MPGSVTELDRLVTSNDKTSNTIVSTEYITQDPDGTVII